MRVTHDGQQIIKEWLNAQQSLERARSSVNSADCDMRNAETALARWMLPDDAKVGEKIALWFGDSLVQVECTCQTPIDGKVTFRKRGAKLYEFAA